MQWFIQSKGKALGPYSEDMLRQIARSGKLKPSELIWRQGFNGWVAASRALPSLFQTAAPTQMRSRTAIRLPLRGLFRIALAAFASWGIWIAYGNGSLKSAADTTGARLKDWGAKAEATVAEYGASAAAYVRERQIEEVLLMDENAPVRALLSQEHQLSACAPRREARTISWQDARGQTMRNGCAYANMMDPEIPVTRVSVTADIDMAAAEALDQHFGYPSPLPSVWTRSDLPQGNAIVKQRWEACLLEHGCSHSEQLIAPDYNWLIRQSVPLVREFAKRTVQRMPRIPNQAGRDPSIVSLVSLVQCGVPYRLVDQRPGWENFGVRSPAMTLLRGGDCDSKSALLASLLRATQPNLPIVLIEDTERNPEGKEEPHMLIGIGIPATPCDVVLTHQGVRYVVVETTDQWQIGQPGKDFRADNVQEVTLVE